MNTLTKVSDLTARLYYLCDTAQLGWTRNIDVSFIDRESINCRQTLDHFTVAKDILIETMPPSPRSFRRWKWPRVLLPGLAVLIWSALIAGSSSTVVLPRTLFDWLREHVFEDDDSLRRFMNFWGYAWFAIVKGWHVTEFAILFTLIHAFLKRRDQAKPRRNLILALTFCFLFAMSDEYHQTYVPGRGGHWGDVAIDSIGIVLAALICLPMRSSASKIPTDP